LIWRAIALSRRPFVITGEERLESKDAGAVEETRRTLINAGPLPGGDPQSLDNAQPTIIRKPDLDHIALLNKDVSHGSCRTSMLSQEKTMLLS